MKIEKLLEYYELDGTPIKCQQCGCEEFKHEITDMVDGMPSEYNVVCIKCNQFANFWAHGYYKPIFTIDEVMQLSRESIAEACKKLLYEQVPLQQPIQIHIKTNGDVNQIHEEIVKEMQNALANTISIEESVDADIFLDYGRPLTSQFAILAEKSNLTEEDIEIREIFQDQLDNAKCCIIPETTRTHEESRKMYDDLMEQPHIKEIFKRLADK